MLQKFHIYFLSKIKWWLLIFFSNVLSLQAQVLLNEPFNSSVLPSGWSNTAIQGTQVWTIRNSPVFSSTSNGYYAVFDDAASGAGVFPNEAKLTCPVINCQGRLSLRLNYATYWASVEGSHGYVEVSSDNGASWVIINDYSGASAGTLLSPLVESIDISAFISNQLQVRFRYSDGSASGKYWYIDDIIIYTDPDVGITKLISPQFLGCSSPSVYSNNEQVTVRLNNFGINPVSNIPVQCEISGGITQNISGTFSGTIAGESYADYTFPVSADLTGSTAYHFRIYTQLPTDRFHFNDTIIDGRHQAVNVFPYLESFNGASNSGWVTGCSDASGADRWFERGNFSYLNGPEGNGTAWFINTSAINSVSDEIWVESPVFDFSGLTSPTLSFDTKYQLDDNDYVWVQYSTNGGLNWLTLGSNNDANWYNGAGAGNNFWRNNVTNPVSSWTNVRQRMCPLSGEPCVIFRIKARPYYNTAGTYYFAFDNFRISAGESDDIEPLALYLPKSGACSLLFSASENLKLVIKNNTCRPLANIPVTLVQSGAGTSVLNDTIPGPVNRDERYVCDFSGTLNMTGAGTHLLTVTTNLATDTAGFNNTITEDRFATKINSFPVTADFNATTCGWVSGSNVLTNPNKRIFLRDTVPYLGGSQGNGKSWFIEVSSANSVTNEIWAESPEYDFTNISTGFFSMDIKYQLHNSDYVWVEYSTNGGSVWSTLGTNTDPDWYNSTGTNNNYWRNNINTPVSEWTHVQHTLCNLSNKPCVKFRVKARPYQNTVDSAGGHYYFAFDNVQITELAGDIGILSYLSPADNGCLFGTNEHVSVSLFNFSCNPLTDIPVQCNITGSLNLSLSDTITDTIQPGSAYYYNFADPLDLTSIGTYNFTTFTKLSTDGNLTNDTVRKSILVEQIKISSFPYNENFDSGNGYWITGSTDTASNHRWFERGSLPYLNGPGANGDSWFINADSVNSQTGEIWVESPVFDFTYVNEALLSFDIKYQLDNSDYVWVQYTTNGGLVWNTLGENTDAGWYNGTGSNHNWIGNFINPVTDWTTVQHFLCGTGGSPCVKFRIRARPFSNAAGRYYFAFDNFNISLIASGNVDVGVNNIMSPAVDGCLYSPPDKAVILNVTNYGCSNTSGIPLLCNITGPLDTTLGGTVINNLASGNSVYYTFPVSISMSDTGTYHFTAYTNVPGDIDHGNDTAQFSVYIDQVRINTFPYIADFNADNQYWKTGGNDTAMNDRWFERGNLPYLNGSQGNGNSFFVNVSANNSSYEEIRVESPVFDFTNTPNPLLSMDIKYQLHNSDYVWVQYSTDGGSNWLTLGSNTDTDWYNATGAGNDYWRNNISSPVNNWTNVRQPLCFLSGKNCVRFRISARPFFNTVDATGGYYYFAFDNFKIESFSAADDVLPVVFFQPDAENCSPFFSATEPVSVIIQNNSCRTISNIPVSVLHSGAGTGALNDTIPGPVGRFSRYLFTFQGTLDLSNAGTHNLTAITHLVNDIDPENDTCAETRVNNAISIFPYVESFNAGNNGWACSSSEFYNPNNRIFLLDTLPYLNGAEGNGKSWYVDVSSLNSVSDEIWVESPSFDISQLTAPKLMMEIKSQLHNSDYVWVEYTIDGGTVWTVLGTNSDPEWYHATGTNNNYWRNNLVNPDSLWKTVQHSLCGLTGNTCVKFRIKARPYYNTIVYSPVYTGYYFFAFDNFRIIDGGDIGILNISSPSNQECLFSSSEYVTVNIFNWGCSPESNIPLSCQVSGTLSSVLNGMVTDSIYPGTLVSYTFPGTLDMTTIGSYDFTAVAQLPGDINQLNDTARKQFQVSQVKINSFPYKQDFDSGSDFWITGSSDTTVNHRWFELGAIPYLNGPEGQGNSWFINADAVNSQTAEIWAESPLFDFTGIVNPSMSFDVKYQLHNFNYSWLQYSADGGISWATLGTNADPGWYNTTGSNNNYWRNNTASPVGNWTTLEHNLCELAGQPCVKFRFRARPFYNQPGYYYFAFDNFHIYSSNLDVQVLDAAGCFGAGSPVAIRVRNNSNIYSCGAGIASASEIANPVAEARFAFDGNTTVSGWGNNSSLPCWLEYNFAGNPVILSKYKVLCSSTQNGNWNSELYNPKSWKFQAFNGTSWITMDSVADGLLQMDVVKEFPVTGTNAYERYRIYITAAEGGQRTHITELLLFPAPSTIPVLNSVTLNCSINGNIVSSVFSGLYLAPGADTMLVMNGTFIPDSGSSVIVWSSLPNSMVDLRNYNDTIKPDVAASWPDCNIHCINATELINSVTISTSTYNLPDHPVYDGSTEDYNLNLCADPDTFTVDQSVWYYFHTDCNGGNVKITFQSLNNGPLGIQVAILQIQDDSCICNPAYYNNVFCSASDAASSSIVFNDTLPVNSLYYIMVDPSGNTASDFKIVIEGSVDTLQSGLGADTAICAAIPFLLNSSETGNYSWWISGDTANIISTSQSFTVSPLVSTTYFIEVTAASGCKITDSINISVNPSFIATIDSVQPLCSDYIPVNMVAADSGGFWSGSGITDSVSGLFDPGISGTGAHQVIYFIPGICGDTDTTIVTVISRLYAAITPAGPFCNDDPPLELIAADTSGIWAGPGITDSVTGIFNPAVSGEGVHQITYTIAGQCGDTGTTGITVNAVPDPTINNPGFICVLDTFLNLSAADTGGIWSGQGITDTVNGSFSPSFAGAGNHQVKYTIPGICARSDSILITVHAPSDASVIPAGPFCISDPPFALQAADTGGVWAGNGITDSLNGIFDPVSAGQGLHQVIYTIPGTCGSADTITISVMIPPALSITPADSFCSNDPPVILTVNISGGTWSGTGITNPVNGGFSPQAAGAGIHQVIYETGGFCGNSDTISITVIQSVNADITAPAALCENNQPVSLTAADSGGIWTGTGITDNFSGIYDPGLAGVGSHSISYTISGYCGDADSVLITVNPAPVATVSNDTSVCQGKPVTLKATGGISYHWSNNAANAMITVTPAVSTWYFVTVSNGLCSIKDSIRITVLTLPNATASGNSPVCKGETIYFTSGGGSQYNWNGPSGFSSASQNPSVADAGLNHSGNYIVTVTGTNGCVKNVVVNIVVGNTFTVSQSIETCSGMPFTLPGGNIAEQTGIYADTLQSSSGCDSIITTNLTVFPSPQVFLTGLTDSLLIGQQIIITANGAENYQWSSGENTQGISLAPSAAGQVSYCVTGTNGFNCKDTECADIIAYMTDCGDGQLFIPGAFSPNNDGNNDLLCIYGKACIEKLDFKIFDRWGEVIFESKIKEDCWNGLFKGKELNASVFVYFLEATLKDGTHVNLQGNISLMK